MKTDAFGCHHRLSKGLAVLPVGHERSMNTDQPAMLPQAELESSDVADAHQKLRVAPSCRKIQPISDAARALSTACREERAHSRVAQCGVEIRQAFFVSAREPGHFAKNMLAEIDCEPQLSSMFAQWEAHSLGGGLAGDTNRTLSPLRSGAGIRARSGSARAVSSIERRSFKSIRCKAENRLRCPPAASSGLRAARPSRRSR